MCQSFITEKVNLITIDLLVIHCYRLSLLSYLCVPHSLLPNTLPSKDLLKTEFRTF